MRNVKATVISSTDIQVNRDEPDAGGAGFTIDRYILRIYRQSSTSMEKLVEVDGSQTTATLSGLSESTTYRIEVSANNGQNTGAPSDGTLATTEKKSSSCKEIAMGNNFVCQFASSRKKLRKSLATSLKIHTYIY